ncbi:MAG: nitrous oxide reductase accessory protein NosL [Acidobacteria bacterium]|nr:nitrous oxide reductase accessory protein NosL [Acidobacteriota bacterium]MBI3663049.1 nitrous oxide reductase accessory protein NosL [Acidobacteriota bacterium]
MPKSVMSKTVMSIVVLALLTAGGYWLLQRTTPAECKVCRREIHAAARAVIEVDGKQEAVCCVRCAMTLDEQEQKPVRLVEVTDYIRRKALAPEDAFYVEGSRIVLCQSHEPHLDETKHAQSRVFDRCEPSVYAFARREEAEAFAAQNGGAVLRFAELMKELSQQAPAPAANAPAGARTQRKP